MISSRQHSEFVWNAGTRSLRRGRVPLLMGILNVTPDSFSDGGQHATIDAAVAHGQQLAEDGADIIDIGGESTRPGSAVVDCAEELRRTIPVIRKLAAELTVPISIDTTKAEVARQALNAGATIVNDISGLTFDPGMLEVCRNSTAGLCLMHIQGTPQTMQADPCYDNVVREVTEFLRIQLMRCVDAGIEPDRICIDPGIGFGKTAEHNLQLLSSVAVLQGELQRPVLVGHSRKRFLSRLLDREVDELLCGTIGVSIALAGQGVDILRIHEVRAVRDALLAWSAVHFFPDGTSSAAAEQGPVC